MKTTKKHFELYKKSVAFWLDYYGLKGWEIAYVHKDWEGNMAYVEYDITGRCATFGLAVNRDKKFFSCPYSIELDAFHEVGELLLSQLTHLCYSRFIIREQIDIEIHNVIRTLENVIFKPMKLEAK